MMRSLARRGALLLIALLVSVPATAQTVQSLHLGVGGVFPKGLDGRTEGDILVRNFEGELIPGFSSLSDALLFELGDFKSAQILGEWTLTFGERIELGAGLGYYSRSVPTVYADLVDEGDREIEQTLRLRVVPLTGIVRFLPFGRAGDVQPYVGAGIAALNYRYSEIGEFVDTATLDIFEERYVATGTAPGGLLLGGVRLPLGGDVYGLTIEGRYQFGTGETGGFETGFVADKIDLSGGQLNVGLLIRF